MTSERWRQIEDLYHAALAREPEARPAFLGNACLNDEELRREVESLLVQNAPGEILNRSLKSIVAEVLPAEERFAAGYMVGPYRIVEPLGAGGMGQVYRATDTRLGRDVALKVLRADQFADPERRARFIKEARAASALNHPNIITIHDIVTENGRDFIVMEYVKGDTLATKIARREPRLAQTLKYAAQIADALARAHAAGIVHRDLKPQNIMVAGDGAVKVLDFGLAKLSAALRAAGGATAAMEKSSEGVILGTASYMSPEQVRGGEVDHRSDIFSFGLVFHEMLCGNRAFQGQSPIEVMNAILNETPPELPDTVPPALRQIVAGCLEKDPAVRFESARDLAFALRAFSGIGAAVPRVDTAVRASGRPWLLPALAASVLVLAVLAAALYIMRPEPLDLSAYRFKPFATDAEMENFGSWSPDGKSVAYTKQIDRESQVMIRSLDAPTPTQLTRVPSGVHWQIAPFFSRDGERVYFVASGALWSVAAVGGEPREVLRAPMAAVTLSPDGKTLAFWRPYKEAGKQYSAVWISSPPGAPPRKYEPTFRLEGVYIPDFLRFSPDGSQIGVATFRVSGEAGFWILPWPDGPKVRPRQAFSSYSFHNPPAFDWMPDSRHICLSADDNLWLGDSSTGKLQQLTAMATGAAKNPAVSPGGERVVFTTFMEDYDIVEVPLDGSPLRPLLVTARSEISPSWSPAGDQMAFITDRSGESEIWLRHPSGNWERPAVRQSDFPDDPGQPFRNVAFSPDGTRLAYCRHGRLWISPVSGGRASQAVVGDEREAGVASWSPDSSSITYLSIIGGAAYVAVTRVGSQQPQFLVSSTAGQCASAPVWSPDGLWIACGGQDDTVLLVSPDGKQRRSLPSPVPADFEKFVLVWSRNAETIYLASAISKGRLDAIDVRTGRSRKIVEYPWEVRFNIPATYSQSGSLSRDGKSFATTVSNHKSDLWIL